MAGMNYVNAIIFYILSYGTILGGFLLYWPEMQKVEYFANQSPVYIAVILLALYVTIILFNIGTRFLIREIHPNIHHHHYNK